MQLTSEISIVVGAALMLLAAIGVLRFPDLYSRMHAATKVSTLGLLSIVVGALFVTDEGRAKLVLTVALIFVTAPVASHLVGRAAYRAEGIEVRFDAVDELGDLIDAERRSEDPEHPVEGG